jgi:hypothetical protein
MKRYRLVIVAPRLTSADNMKTWASMRRAFSNKRTLSKLELLIVCKGHVSDPAAWIEYCAKHGWIEEQKR